MENHLIDIGANVLQAVLLGLVAIMFAWIQSKTKSDRIRNALGSLQVAVTATVGELKSKTVDGLRAARQDGKLTADEIKELEKTSLQLVLSRLDQPSITLLDSAYQDLDDLITSLVKAEVEKFKTSAPPPLLVATTTNAVAGNLVAQLDAANIGEGR